METYTFENIFTGKIIIFVETKNGFKKENGEIITKEEFENEKNNLTKTGFMQV